MCVCICVRVDRGVCESPAQKYLIHWVIRCAHVLSQKVLGAAGNMDWCGGAQPLFEFCDFVREAEGIDLSSQIFGFNSFFACISVVCVALISLNDDII